MLQFNQSDLLVNLHEFSRIACLDGRLFGVQTASDSCTLELNSCLRGQALEALIAANRRAEADLGYDLVPRYHVGLMEFTGGADKAALWVSTDRPGVAAVNVKQEITSAILGVDISPYLGPVAISDGGEGYCIATVPAALIDNPSKLTLRSQMGLEYHAQSIGNYPRKVGSDWLIAIRNDDAPLPCAATPTLYVQHHHLVFVDIPASITCLDCAGDVDTAAQILPVYPGTNDFIPLARPIETVGSFKRYWFYVWTLVDPAFQDEQVDLTHAEFWKLFSTVDFVCVREVPAGPEVVYPADCNGTITSIPNPCAVPPVEAKYDVTIRDAEEGTLSFKKKGQWESDATVTIKYYYKTDPAVLGFTNDLPNIAAAIAYRAAADLPSTYCGCTISSGFIAEAQKSFGNAFLDSSGQTVWVVKFGHKNGQFMYEQKMASAPKYQKTRSL